MYFSFFSSRCIRNKLKENTFDHLRSMKINSIVGSRPISFWLEMIFYVFIPVFQRPKVSQMLLQLVANWLPENICNFVAAFVISFLFSSHHDVQKECCRENDNAIAATATIGKRLQLVNKLVYANNFNVSFINLCQFHSISFRSSHRFHVSQTVTFGRAFRHSNQTGEK